MSEESKEIDPKVDEAVVEQFVTPQVANATDNDQADEEEPADITNPDAVAAGSSAKKKKSKRAKLKKAFGVGSSEDGGGEGSSGSSNPASKLTTGMVEQLLEMNPSLKSEVAGMDKEKAAATLKKLDVADLLTGMVIYTECMTVFAALTQKQVREWEKPKRHGFIQILADSASASIWSVSARRFCCHQLTVDRRDPTCRRRSN